MELITKSTDSHLEVNEGKREVLAVISSDAVDRDGEVVSPRGMKKKNFSGNPVVMKNHDYSSLPIGKALWVKADGNKVLSKYRVSDATQEARDVFGLLQDGTLKAHSIGFISHYKSKPTTKEINERPDLADAKLIHRDWSLHEFSVVGVPCNPEALALAVSKGYSPTVLNFLGGKKLLEGLTTEVVERTIIEVAKPDAQQLREAIFESVRKMPLKIDIEKAISIALKRLSENN